MSERQEASERWYDANDAEQLRAFDDDLWAALAAARAYFEEGLGPLKGVWDLFGANHRGLWVLVEQHGNLDLPVQLRIVPREKRAPVVEIRQTQLDESELVVITVDGLELIGGKPSGEPWGG
jgi:hypothetical protein